jgi:two-component system chemotaxis response regulator CheB
VPATEIGPLLPRLVHESARAEPLHAADCRRELAIERDAVASDSGWKRRIMELKPTPYTCPSCHGVMFEIPEGDRRRFRCHTGHGYTIGALLPKLVEDSEDMLWNAVRAVEEAITLCREAAGDLRQNGEAAAAQALLDRAQRANAKLELLRGLTLEDAGLLGEP